MSSRIKGQILATILITLLLTISVEGREIDKNSNIVQASEILSDIAENKIIDYNNVTIEGDICFGNGTTEHGKAIYITLNLPDQYFNPKSSPKQILNETKKKNDNDKMLISALSVLSISTHRGRIPKFPEPVLQNTSCLSPYLVLNLPNTTYVNSKISIRDSVIKGNVQFNNTKFLNEISFSNTTFCENVYFVGSEFSGVTNFEKANFQVANFCYSKFLDIAIFKKAIFNELAFFPGTYFNGKADFGDARFMGYADFFIANFNKSIKNKENKSLQKKSELNEAYSTSSVIITNDHGKRLVSKIFLHGINGPIETMGYTLIEAASKYYYEIKEFEANFNKAYFNKTANFVGTRFSETASFEKCIFNGDTFFAGTNFAQDVSFNQSNFVGDSDFFLANFNNSSYFGDTTFLGYVGFSSANSMNNIYFSKAKILKYADFSNANFTKSLNFNEAEFSSINLENARFGDSSNLSIDDCSLIRSSASSILIDWDTVSSHLVKNCPSFIAFIKNFKNQGKYEDADNCYYEYRDWWRQQDRPFDGSQYVDTISWLTCGYGVRWTHTLLFGILIMVLFSIKYLRSYKYHHNIKPNLYNRILESQFFSLIILISAPNYFYPYGIKKYNNYSNFNKYSIILERLLGWALLVLLIGTISRVMIRY